jgi:hypothetical protein
MCHYLSPGWQRSSIMVVDETNPIRFVKREDIVAHLVESPVALPSDRSLSGEILTLGTHGAGTHRAVYP